MNYLSSQSFDSLKFFSSPRDIKIIVAYFLKGFENSHYLREGGGKIYIILIYQQWYLIQIAFHFLWQNTKDSLQRSLQWVDSELMRVSVRPEWPALLHNLCMLHSLVRLRTRFGLTGWNKPMDLRNLGTAELWVSITDHLCGRFRLFTEADLIIWRKQFFSAARVGSGCTRVSRQCRYGMARGWINEAYPVEWITVYVNRGTPSPPTTLFPSSPPPHVTWENEWTLFVWAKFLSLSLISPQFEWYR